MPGKIPYKKFQYVAPASTTSTPSYVGPKNYSELMKLTKSNENEAKRKVEAAKEEKRQEAAYKKATTIGKSLISAEKFKNKSKELYDKYGQAASAAVSLVAAAIGYPMISYGAGAINGATQIYNAEDKMDKAQGAISLIPFGNSISPVVSGIKETARQINRLNTLGHTINTIGDLQDVSGQDYKNKKTYTTPPIQQKYGNGSVQLKNTIKFPLFKKFIQSPVDISEVDRKKDRANKYKSAPLVETQHKKLK